MSKFTYIFDYGHGGLINGVYVTPGKRSPRFDNGFVLYEGVNNRDNVHRIMNELKILGIDCVDIVNSNEDTPLQKRVNDANKLGTKKNCIYISIHSDANGDGKVWDNASGISVYTSKGQTKSDIFASIIIDELESNFRDKVKWRKDLTDKDEDKEENFYVLANTNMPSILCELGFHTNKIEAERMLTDKWKDKIVKSIVSGIQKWENLNK